MIGYVIGKTEQKSRTKKDCREHSGILPAIHLFIHLYF